MSENPYRRLRTQPAALGSYAATTGTKRQLEFIDKQLRDLYSPLLSLRKEVRALSELRERISGIADETWQERVQKEGAKSAHFEPFGRIIEYDNEQMKIELLPHYDKMLETLRTNLYLADESIRQYRPALVEYTELWHRHLDGSISGELLAKLDVREQSLQPLYDNIATTFVRLRAHPLLGSNRPTLVEHLQPAPEVLQCRRPPKFDDTLRPRP